MSATLFAALVSVVAQGRRATSVCRQIGMTLAAHLDWEGRRGRNGQRGQTRAPGISSRFKAGLAVTAELRIASSGSVVTRPHVVRAGSQAQSERGVAISPR